MIRFSIIIVYIHVFFFFKQKTAYEMRISDWSSDVCSSDLPLPHVQRDGIAHLRRIQRQDDNLTNIVAKNTISHQTLDFPKSPSAQRTSPVHRPSLEVAIYPSSTKAYPGPKSIADP